MQCLHRFCTEQPNGILRCHMCGQIVLGKDKYELSSSIIGGYDTYKLLDWREIKPAEEG